MKLELEDARWSAFVNSCAGVRAFHHPAWARMLSDCYGFGAFALALTREDGEIVGGLPVLEVKRPLGARRWVSLPFTDFCPPLGRRVELPALIAEAAGAARAAGVSRLELHAPVEAPGAYSRVCGVIHLLELADEPEAVLRTFSKSQVQRNIRRAQREPLTLRRGKSESDLADVFYGLHIRTRRKHGLPVQPRRFFDLLWRRVLEPGLGFVLLAYSGPTPVAGAVFLTWNGTVTYKYGASNPHYLNMRPNHLIFWHAIQWSCEHGYHTFDFGRSELDHRGLREFKNGWGTREEPLIYSGIGSAPPGPSKHTQLAMGAVIRHAPLWVTRVLGEAFYPLAA